MTNTIDTTQFNETKVIKALKNKQTPTPAPVEDPRNARFMSVKELMAIDNIEDVPDPKMIKTWKKLKDMDKSVDLDEWKKEAETPAPAEAPTPVETLPPPAEPRKRGRKPKYTSDEERIQARRL